MEEGKKVPFGEVSKEQATDHFQKLDYMKVKIIYHNQDKSTKAVTYLPSIPSYKCSSR